MSDALALLFEAAEQRLVEVGTRLFHSGDTVRHMFLVVAGGVNLTRVTGAGAPVVQQRARPGMVLAEASAYSRTYHCDAHAVKDALVRAIPVGTFRARLASDPALADGWAAHLAQAVQSARLRAEIRTLRTVAERLDAWLEEGRTLPAKGLWQDLAAELGVSREALYRELSRRRISRS
ncbi:cAMP-binding domain of CRP or a regulatory subunit of cAMP-dependent protein kinases [Pleomorphomonas diazotrophica]|nr:Crp/Fnr family transcriptional regulator [Pleomorphomonas diazotrophica]SFM74029.1 cAMP-binding domain of CRP or a regulatory subunit of cAMP-dependent protein kinases [Pleomorphomonas diazotrophica]